MARLNQEIAADTDIDYLAGVILVSLNAQLFHYQRTVLEFSPERISTGLCAFVAH
jgi:hypothetical protein